VTIIIGSERLYYE